MAMIDVGGGEYRDLDTGMEYTQRQFCDVIAEKISREFADIIAEMLDETAGDMEYIIDEKEHLDRLTDEYLEVFYRIGGLADDFRIKVEQSQRLHKKTVVKMFEEIINEVNQYT